jgi:hypothetical protein
MDTACLVLANRRGKTEDARAFQLELATGCKADYDRSERRRVISKELWYLASWASGGHLLASK